MLDKLPSGAKVLIIRLRSLGDCVLTTPAIHILKQSRPDLRVAVMVEDRFADVFRRNPDIECKTHQDVGSVHHRVKLAGLRNFQSRHLGVALL